MSWVGIYNETMSPNTPIKSMTHICWGLFHLRSWGTGMENIADLPPNFLSILQTPLHFSFWFPSTCRYLKWSSPYRQYPEKVLARANSFPFGLQQYRQQLWQTQPSHKTTFIWSVPSSRLYRQCNYRLKTRSQLEDQWPTGIQSNKEFDSWVIAALIQFSVMTQTQ